MGAVALGVLLATSLTDMFGVGLLAAGGLLVLPWIKSSLKSSTSKKIEQVRHLNKSVNLTLWQIRVDLKSTLDLHLNGQLDVAMEELQQALQPYTRFVSQEQKKISSSQTNLKKMEEEVVELRQEVTKVFGVKK